MGWANWGLFGLIGAYSLQMNSHATPIGRDFAAVLGYADYRNFQSVKGSVKESVKGSVKGSVLDIGYSPPSFLRRYKKWLR